MKNKIILLIFCSFSFLYGQIKFSPDVDNLIKKGLDNLLNHNYSKAEEYFKEINDIDKEESIGLIYLAATKIVYSIDFEIELDVNYVDGLLKKAQEINKKRFGEREDLLEVVYYKGLIEGISAYAAYSRGDWIQAFRNGYKAIKTFDKVLEIDPNNADALIAIGIFKFWKSRKTEFASFLPFVKDERLQGIEMLKRGISGKANFRFLGINSLAWILIDQKRSVEAIETLQLILKYYPEFRFSLWAEARAYEDIDIEKAILSYKKLLNLIRKAKQNGYNEIVILHILAQKEFQKNDLNEAMKYIKEIENLKPEEFVKRKLSSRYKRIEKLKNEIEQINNANK